MVAYGSDYLLGLSTFAPDLFARRDALWEAGDPRFYELHDLLPYPGALPLPAAGCLALLRRRLGVPVGGPGLQARRGAASEAAGLDRDGPRPPRQPGAA